MDVATFPTKNFSIPVDTVKVLKNGTLTKDLAKNVVSKVQWTLNRNGVNKNYLMVLDLLATFNWDRPIYFATSYGPSTFLGLQKYWGQKKLQNR